MEKDTLRMQFLSGVITEGQYKQKLLNELQYFHNGAEMNQIINYDDSDITDDLEFLGQGSMDGQDFTPGSTHDIGGKEYKIEAQGDEFKLVLDEEGNESLNESMIGGIVGIGAINQIPPRAKANYETAFEHFLGGKYGLNEEEEMEELLDPMVKEGDENIILRAYEIAEEMAKKQLEFPDDAIENKDLYLEVIKALKDILYGKASDIFDKRAGSAPDEYSSDRTISNQNLNKSAYIDGRIEYTSEELN